jgi:outer membrane immunogenic protein
MKLNHILVSGIALVMSGSLALSADLPAPIPEEPVDTQYDWSGFYLGLHLGYSWSQADIISALPNNPGSLDLDGWFGGAQIGWNWHLSNVVVGIEGDISGSDIKRSTVLDPGGPGSSTLSSKLDYIGTIRGRIGLPMDNWLFFATGGAAFGHTKNSITNLFGCCTIHSNGNTHWGWTLGGGVEWAVSEHVTLKTEYRYMDLGNKGYAFTPVATANASFKGSNVILGANYKF